MTSLTAIFGDTREGNADSEKLLELYWNRAELKKEFANLRDETFRLNSRIKEEQGRTARYGQRLEHLENLLLDPDWVHNVLAFYQLCALNAHLKRKLDRFAEQLKQQREKRQEKQRLATWQASQSQKAAALKQERNAVNDQVRLAEGRLEQQRQELAGMGAFMRLLRKRSVTRKLDTQAKELDDLRSKAVRLQAAVGEIENSQAPDTAGLDVASKRSINFMILSFAQQIYLHFEDDQLAPLAREAGEKGVGAINYGTLSDVLELLARIKRQRASMKKSGECAGILQKRAKLIAERARFKSGEEAVPEKSTVATLFDFDEKGNVSESRVNLLGENYWNLQRVLSA